MFIEIETSTFCNRKCFFCPNVFIDRHSKQTYMEDEVYLSVLHQLRDIGYSKLLSLHRYNEPLADPKIFDRFTQARECLPNAQLTISTNGDYLTRQVIERLLSTGLDNIEIAVDYFDEKETFTMSEAEARISRRVDQIGMHMEETGETKSSTRINRVFQLHNMRVSITAADMTKEAVNRAGLLQDLSKEKRVSPCLKAFTFLAIDHNGCLMPCCNFRSDAASHVNHIIGNLREEPLIDLYFSDKYTEWRKRIFPFRTDLPAPCSYCSDATFPETAENVLLADASLMITAGETPCLRALRPY